jgi:hypothetical protein
MTKEDVEAAKMHSEIEGNKPVEFYVGRKKYKVKRLGWYVQTKIDELVIQSQFAAGANDGSAAGTIKVMKMNRRIVPKVISLLILRNIIKIRAFHWLHWRLLFVFGNIEEWAKVINKMYNGEESRLFFYAIEYLQANVSITKEMTSQDMKTIRQKHSSETGTTQ